MHKVLFNKYRQTIITLAVILIVGIGIWLIHSTGSQSNQTDTQKLNQVLNPLGKLMILPTGEQPTLATVVDKSKLKNQTVFSKAENGDKILVYTKAQKIIIYRPSADKIVDIEPLITDKKGSPYVNSKIAILNGSGNPDALTKMTRSVVSAFPNSTIVLKDNAPRNFPQSIAIDLTKQDQPLDEQIADTLGIKSGQLPLGVSAPDADFLIIIGQDYH